MVSVKLPKMDEDEIKDLLKNKSICRIAFIDEGYPYISPFQYVYFNKCLYFHFTDYGKKKNILLKNGNVCVSIEEFAPDLTSYKFISIQGNLKLIKDNKTSSRVNELVVMNFRIKMAINTIKNAKEVKDAA